MKYALLFFILIYTNGCGSQKQKAESLDGVWKVASVDNEKITNIDATKCIINLDDSSLVISIGCNNHTASFKIIDDKTTQISNVIATEKFCPDLSELENRLGSALPTVSNYTIENGVLSLFNNNGKTAIKLIR